MAFEVKVTKRGNMAASIQKLRGTFPKIEAAAINSVAKKARTHAVREVAKTVGVSQKFIRHRFTKATTPLAMGPQGAKGRPRVKLGQAHHRRLWAILSVYSRGIPVYQVATSATKKGVKRRGKRLYKGAFATPAGLVFKRRSNDQLMLPKIGVRQLLRFEFTTYLQGAKAKNEFSREFNRLLTLNLKRFRN